MGIYETTQLYLGIATIVAALAIIYYSRSKSATMDSDSRRAFRPLYVVAIGFVVLGLGAFATFFEEILGQAILFETSYAFYAAMAVEVVIFGIAAAMIMDSRRFYSIPIVSGIASIILFYIADAYPQTSDFLLLVGVLFPTVILVGIGGLFTWIVKETKRSTSAALAFALFTQIAALPVLYYELFLGPEALFALFFVLMGPAMTMFAFLRPDQKISFELAGYGAAFAAPGLILSSIQTSGLAIDITFLSIALAGACAIVLSIGTASYLYGRWSETRQLPTILFMTAFLLFAIGQMTGMLSNVSMFPDPDGIYIEFLLTGYALTFLSVGAIYASGWKSAGLIPMLAFMPISVLIAQAYPADIGVVFMNLIVIIVPTIGLMLLPSIVFLGVWRRMRSNKIAGSLRPLGVAIAIILFFVIRLPPMVLGLAGLDYGYGVVIVSFLLFWSALTGRLDRITPTPII
ncbi:MAG: hypothetical protein ACXAAO_10190 [Candidatus Thorarchaeota archaeon]|jgi:hypothetical protein